MIHTKQAWELAAEKLVGDVRRLLDHHGALVEALGKSLGRAEAESRLHQLDGLVVALDMELWRVGTAPDRTLVGSIATALKRGLAGAAFAVPTTVATLATSDAYNAWTAADAQADQVIECVIEADERNIGAGDGQPAPKVPPASPSTTPATSAQHPRSPSSRRRFD
jgi:hypothetical protein